MKIGKIMLVCLTFLLILIVITLNYSIELGKDLACGIKYMRYEKNSLGEFCVDRSGISHKIEMTCKMIDLTFFVCRAEFLE